MTRPTRTTTCARCFKQREQCPYPAACAMQHAADDIDPARGIIAAVVIVATAVAVIIVLSGALL